MNLQNYKQAIKPALRFLVVALVLISVLFAALNFFKVAAAYDNFLKEQAKRAAIEEIKQSAEFQLKLNNEAEKEYYELQRQNAEARLGSLEDTGFILPPEALGAPEVQNFGRPTIGQMAAATRVCRNHSLATVQCRDDLLAIVAHETRGDPFKCQAIGADGEVGCFQILPSHNFAGSDDFEKAADWTLARMLRLGYQSNRAYAIQCHNGCNAGNGYAYQVMKISKTGF